MSIYHLSLGLFRLIKTKNFFYTAMARSVVIVCQILSIKLLTAYLSPKQIGFYFFILTIAYFSNAAIFVPIDHYVQANLLRVRKETGGLNFFLNLNRRLLLIYFVIILMIGTFFYSVDRLSQYIPHVFLAGSLSFGLYLVQTLRNALNNLLFQSHVSISLVIESMLKLIVFFLLLKCSKLSELVPLIAWNISLLICSIFLCFIMAKKELFRSRVNRKIDVRKITSFSYPITIGAISNWIQTQGYRLILVPLGMSEVVGIFSTICSIGSAGMSAASLIFMQYFSPRIYQTNGIYTSRYLRNALYLVFGTLVLSLLMGKIIVYLMTNDLFLQYWPVIIIGVLVEGSNLLIGALSVHITLKGDTREMNGATLAGLLTLVISFLIIYSIYKVNVFTVGLPLVLSQLAVFLHMYRKFRNG